MNFNGSNINLSKKEVKNTIRYDNIDYLITDLSELKKGSKGGNSNVFKLLNPQTEDEFVIKFSKYNINKPNNPLNIISRITRFAREVEALKLASNLEFNNIIQYYFDDYKDIGAGRFHYYVMEKADYDLTQYLDKNDISDQQRLFLCTDILNGIKQLHNKDIYHRDIKPDNILYVNKTWKIGDLGLVENRNSEFKIKEVGEKIGPIGWLSPEATNKYLNEGEGKLNKHGFDCKIDEYSDVFQLGKLFWYIFQGNIPIGQIEREDFKIADDEIYDIIFEMLKHSKHRPTLDEIEDGFKSRYSYYGL
jgi:serine/threonine protein kinase